MVCRFAGLPVCHAMMTEGRQDWVQDVRNISNNGLGYFRFVANRQTGKPFGKSIYLWRINEKRDIYFIFIYIIIYIKYNYYTTLLHAPYHISEKTKWFAGLPVCRYAIINYTCKEKVLKIGGLRMDKLEWRKGYFGLFFRLFFAHF